MARSKLASAALVVAVSTLALAQGGGMFVKAAEDGSCSAGSGEGACQAPVATERANEGGGLFSGFSFASLTGLFGGGEKPFTFLSTTP